MIDQIKSLILDAHMAGQHSAGIDASYHEALAYYYRLEKNKYLEVVELKDRIKKLEFMIDSGLGWEDMKNDTTV